VADIIIDVSKKAHINSNGMLEFDDLDLQNKSVSFTPAVTTQTQTVKPDQGYDGLNKVFITVEAIPNKGGGGGSGSAQAIAYHSITIGDKNTWDDWHLVPTSRPKFNMPPVKTQYIDIPGSDGVLDLTTALTGRPMYGNRQGSFEFLVMNDYGNWYDRYSEIATYLHGRSFRAVLNDDPLYYYEGRFSVNEWKSERDWSRLVIDYNVGPYKLSTLSPGERWLWDPFRFTGTATGRGDIIQSYKNIMVNGTTEIDYIGDVYESSFVINVLPRTSGEEPSVTFTYDGKSYLLKKGTQTLTAVKMQEGNNHLVFTGRGILTIENTGGRL